LWDSLFVPPTADHWLALQLHRAGIMGRETKRWLAQTVGANAVIVDVGANQGIFALLAARLAGPAGRVLAFEPEPMLSAALAGNVALNDYGTIESHPIALGSGPGRLAMQRGAFNSGDNRLRKGQGTGEPLVSSVRVESWDGLGLAQQVDVLKIDVQGWEYEVLEGMREALRTRAVRHILMEFWPHGLRLAGAEPEEVLRMLHEAGYRLSLNDRVRQEISDREFASFCRGVGGTRFVDLVASVR